MDLKEIERLLTKYYDGKSSLEEERKLSAFFYQNEVPEHLRTAQEKFIFFKLAGQVKSQVKKMEYPFTSEEKRKENRALSFQKHRVLISGLAASIVLFIAFYFYPDSLYQTNQSRSKLAYMQTKEALLLVSKKLNKGTDDLKKLAKLNEAQELITKENELP